MISILNQRSDTHNRCEDTVWTYETAQSITGGIFDGCSTGINSAWASQTYAYVFERVTKHYHSALLDDVILLAMEELQGCQSHLGLTEMNFLSTALLFVYNKISKTLFIRCFGDGVYYINDIEYVIEQNNTPDYIGYYLQNNELGKRNYLNNYPILSYENVTHFQICSDGIKAIMPNQFLTDNTDPYSLLLKPPTSENYLKRMWNILKKKHFTLSDDLSIISYATT